MTRRRMFFKMVMSSLIRRRSRMLVALLAVTIGATVFLGMASVYYDIPQQMGREMRAYGANMVLVPSGSEGLLALDEAAKAEASVPQGKLVGATPFRYETMYYHLQGLTVVGTNMDNVRKTSPYWQIQGDWPQREMEVMVGTDISENARLYSGSSFEMEIVQADGKREKKEFRVSGVVRSGGPEDGFVLMPLALMEKLAGNEGKASIVEMSIAGNSAELESLAEKIQHEVPAVTPRLVKRIMNSEASVLGKLQVLVYLVTAIVLFLTMIGVGTTMMTVVMERRKEIGLKKAIGAENRSIVGEFLGESLALAIVGGILGIFGGYFFSQAVSMSVFGRSVSMHVPIVLLTMVTSLAVTVLASLMPVLRATDVEPSIVLRGE
ncbi:MAG: ABC transporter permease [Mailhella sp.]|nr:ABC transporter permease [Mailhella sp.]